MVIIVNYDLRIFQNINELSGCFEDILLNDVDKSKGKFSLALSGGSTPEKIFKFLSDNYRTKINWNKVNFFWGDERCVIPTDDESNYKMAYDNLLSNLKIPVSNIFRIHGEADPEDEAKRYSEIIKKNVQQKNNFPGFDMIMLGLGEDGHTASIFPNQMDLITDDKICSVALHPVTSQKRITLTGKTINNAKKIIFIVTGEKKSKVVSDILNKNTGRKKYPAGFINPVSGKLIWLLDQAAARLIKVNG